MRIMKLLSSILSDEEIQRIQNAPKRDRTHPLKYLLNFSMRHNNLNEAAYVYYNTEYAFSRILESHLDWIKNNKNKLVDINDYRNVSSFLGEVRALGYLAGAEYSVASVKEAKSNTPEFIIKENNLEIEVEVHSKQYSSCESTGLEGFYNQVDDTTNRPGVSFKEYVITPFGKPKPGENIAENFISKIASIKEDEKQLSNDKTSILWLDFQDEIWQSFSLRDHILPIMTSQEMYYSGSLWYAFYGVKGLPIFEKYLIEPSPDKGFVMMRHEGRFSNTSNMDACIMCFPNDTIIFENPNSKNPLPEWFFEKIHRIRWLDIAYSWINWPEKRLKERIDNEIMRIEALHSKKQTIT